MAEHQAPSARSSPTGWPRSRKMASLLRLFTNTLKRSIAGMGPARGVMPLDKLSAHDLDAFYGAQRKGGLSAATIMHVHRIHFGGLGHGRAMGLGDSQSGEARPTANGPEEGSDRSPA